MDCEQARPILMDYLLEELSAENRDEIRRHLESCAACSAEAGKSRQTLGQLVQGGGFEEIPQRIRLVAEPAGWRETPSIWRFAFWRHSGQLAFSAAGLACVAIALLALFRATVSYQQGNWQIAFGTSATSTAREPLAAPTSTTQGLRRAEVLQLIEEAVAANEAKQQMHVARLMQTAAQQAEERRLRDWREMAESLRYFQAAQVTMWKEQVQSQQYVSALMRQSGTGFTPQP